jgi:drug/metabolite transporter (DMT)-like permease
VRASRAGLLVVVAALAFATSAPLARSAVGISPVAVAAGRTLVAAVVIFALTPKSSARALAALSGKERAALAGVGALLAAHFALFLLGLAWTSLPAAVALVSLEPLSVVIAAWIAFGLRPTRYEGIGVVVATLGALVVASGAGRGEHTLVGDVTVLGAVALFGAYVAAARGLRDAMPALPYAGSVYAVCTLVLAPFAVPLALGAAPPWTTWGAILLLGLVPTLIGHTLVQTAARSVPPAVVAMVSPGETVGSLLIGALAMGAVPTLREGAGAVLVIVGATLAIVFGRAP